MYTATEPWPGGRIWVRTKPKDAGLLWGRACLELGLVWCQWMAGPVKRVAQTLARANGTGLASSPSKSGGIQTIWHVSSGDKPDSEEVTKQAFPTTIGGLVGLPAINALCELRWGYMRNCASHMAGCGVPDTTNAPEIMYIHAQAAQKGLTATHKKNYIYIHSNKYIHFFIIWMHSVIDRHAWSHVKEISLCVPLALTSTRRWQILLLWKIQLPHKFWGIS